MRFKHYVNCRMSNFINKRVAPKGILEKEETEGKLPIYIVVVGTMFEAVGLLKGWKDGASRKHL